MDIALNYLWVESFQWLLVAHGMNSTLHRLTKPSMLSWPPRPALGPSTALFCFPAMNHLLYLGIDLCFQASIYLRILFLLLGIFSPSLSLGRFWPIKVAFFRAKSDCVHLCIITYHATPVYVYIIIVLEVYLKNEGWILVIIVFIFPSVPNIHLLLKCTLVYWIINIGGINKIWIIKIFSLMQTYSDSMFL